MALIAALLLLLAVPGEPTRLVFMIGDGFGPASVTLARECTGRPLIFDELLVGSVATRPVVGTVTDSAAAATALASGVRTRNGVVGMDRLGRPMGTLLEAAELGGLATGLVTTTSMTHATPACFAAHVPRREQTATIATQMLAHDIELMFGGGRRDFEPRDEGGIRDDGRSLTAEASAAGVRFVTDTAGLQALDGTPALGLFGPGQLDYDIDRDPTEQPSLAQMTRRALDLLTDAPDGFMLMVEGGRIDHAGHANDPVAHLYDTLAFEAAVAEALAFVRGRDDTLLVVTADHEAGGLTLGRPVAGPEGYAWDPTLLMGARGSAESLGRAAVAGGDPVELLASRWNVPRPSPESIAAFDAALGAEGTAEQRAQRLAGLFSDEISRAAGVGWANGGHTGVDVHLWAAGPGASALVGHHDNDGLGRALAVLLDLDLEATTRRLREERPAWWAR